MPTDFKAGIAIVFKPRIAVEFKPRIPIDFKPRISKNFFFPLREDPAEERFKRIPKMVCSLPGAVRALPKGLFPPVGRCLAKG